MGGPVHQKISDYFLWPDDARGANAASGAGNPGLVGKYRSIQTTDEDAAERKRDDELKLVYYQGQDGMWAIHASYGRPRCRFTIASSAGLLLSTIFQT